MATTKYYAVKNGRNKGIYTSWNECRAQVDGYSDAIYKAFKTKEAAEDFLESDDYANSNIQNEIEPVRLKAETSNTTESVIAYIDGSYSEEFKKYSYGCVLITDRIIELSGIGENQEAIGMRNVAGELLGAMHAIRWAEKNKFTKITIYHDYEGIAKWATGEWKAKQPSTKKYISFIKKYQQIIGIDFVKVLAHSGVEYNERADRLAKAALLKTEEKPDRKNNSNEEIEIFKTVMLSKEKCKNSYNFHFKNYDVSENKLQKYFKELWKRKGMEEKLIDSYNIIVDPYNLLIACMIKDKNGTTTDFTVNFNEL